MDVGWKIESVFSLADGLNKIDDLAEEDSDNRGGKGDATDAPEMTKTDDQSIQIETEDIAAAKKAELVDTVERTDICKPTSNIETADMTMGTLSDDGIDESLPNLEEVDTTDSASSPDRMYKDIPPPFLQLERGTDESDVSNMEYNYTLDSIAPPLLMPQIDIPGKTSDALYKICFLRHILQ